MIPQIQDPALVSDDVSLVQPYDGGGYGFADPSTFCTRTAIPTAGATGGEIIITTGPDEIFRLMGADVAQIAGARPAAHIIVIDKGGSGESVAITQDFGTPPIGRIDAFPRFIGLTVGPSCVLNGQWTGGDVLTQITFGVYGFRAPLGTVFYM